MPLYRSNWLHRGSVKLGVFMRWYWGLRLRWMQWGPACSVNAVLAYGKHLETARLRSCWYNFFVVIVSIIQKSITNLSMRWYIRGTQWYIQGYHDGPLEGVPLLGQWWGSSETHADNKVWALLQRNGQTMLEVCLFGNKVSLAFCLSRHHFLEACVAYVLRESG